MEKNTINGHVCKKKPFAFDKKTCLDNWYFQFLFIKKNVYEYLKIIIE